mgnify:CR=1 FL=1
MALNFPSSPSDGDTFLGGNGINYIWSDADASWQVYNDPASGIQVWSRDPSVPELFPVNNGDSVAVTNGAGADVINLGSDGNIVASKFTGDVDIESYPSLP